LQLISTGVPFGSSARSKVKGYLEVYHAWIQEPEEADRSSRRSISSRNTSSESESGWEVVANEPNGPSANGELSSQVLRPRFDVVPTIRESATVDDWLEVDLEQVFCLLWSPDQKLRVLYGYLIYVLRNQYHGFSTTQHGLFDLGH